MVKGLAIRVLGPLQADVAETALLLRGPRQARLLAALAVNVPHPVDLDQLIDVVWEVDAPSTARRQVQDLVSRLRKILTIAGCAGDVLTTHGSGYALNIPADAVDAFRFRERVMVARRVRVADAGAAAEMLRAALAMWRGDALVGLACPRLDAQRVSLDELRVAAWEDLVDIEIESGRHSHVLGDLAAMIELHPFRERLVELFMGCLYREGRAADALDAFHRLRCRLAESLGVAPCTEIQRLHETILRGTEPRHDARRRILRPAQLPAARAGFVGRIAALSELNGLAGAQPEAITVAVVVGTAGVGKTALALHWAHAQEAAYPDGQLWINLRGYDSVAPMVPIDALSQLLRALDVPAGQIPSDLDEATAMFRSLLAHRRVLLVLDNARSVTQVRHLLPGGPDCAVVITSRSRLTDLVAHDGALRVTLAPMTLSESIELLTRICGGLVQAESADVAMLIGLCGYLPLALCLTGAYLVDNPHRSIAAQVRALECGTLLAPGRDGEESSAVLAAFDHSYAALTAELQRLFRLLGLAPGADLSGGAAVALLDCSMAETMGMLDRLCAAHMLEQLAGDRYAMHSLLQAYASQRRDAEDDAAELRRAHDRLANWYVEMTTAAANRAYPYFLRLPTTAPVTTEPVTTEPVTTEPDTVDTALAWLDAERSNVVTIIQDAAASGDHATVVTLTDQLTGYFLLRPRIPEWLAVVQLALRSATILDSAAALAAIQLNQALAHRCAGHYRRAVGHDRRALRHAVRAAWPKGQAAALNALGLSYLQLSYLDGAEALFAGALEMSRRLGCPHSTAAYRANLGAVHLRAGRFGIAIEQLEQAAAIQEESMTYLNPGFTLLNLGDAYQCLGELAEARRCFEATAVYGREHGYGYLRQAALRGMAWIHREEGDFVASEATVLAALTIIDDTPDSGSEADAHNVLGFVRCDQGRYLEAVNCHLRALDITAATGIVAKQTMALIGLAEARSQLGQGQTARADGRAAVLLARTAGAVALEGDALLALARVLHRCGDHATATTTADQALGIHISIGQTLQTARTQQLLAQTAANPVPRQLDPAT